MATKRFHRYMAKKGFPLYWLLLGYLVLGYFYPVIGLIALICMIAPVTFSIWKADGCVVMLAREEVSTTRYYQNTLLIDRFQNLSGLLAFGCLWYFLYLRCSQYKCTSRGEIGTQWGEYFGISSL